MKNGLVAAMLLPAFLSAASPAGEKPKLSEAHRKWLEEEVVYIIAPVERDVFFKLRTDRERDLFIEAFWKQRDPSPGTAANEFQAEHRRRIAHANRVLGRETPRPGWRTDRGRIYILLGEPRSIQRYEGQAAAYDTEVWFYQDLAGAGLPAGFNVVFFKEGGHGEFKLYSPLEDGPQALLAEYWDEADYQTAYERLREIDPDLASVSLSLIPGEADTAAGRPGLESEILIQRIESSAAGRVEARYAEKFLRYKDLVEVEYTANYLDSDSLLKVFRDPSGLYFVHYAVEPRRLSVDQRESTFATTLKVNGRVTTADGRLVHQFDKTVPLSLTAEQMNEARRAPFDFQDLFPLVGGDYTVSVLIKNEASKEFTSIERSLRIPGDGPAVQLTQPLLGYRVTRPEPRDSRLKAFRIGSAQVSCQPNRVFTRGETLAVAFQIHNLPGEAAAGGEVGIAFLKDGQVFREIRRRPADYAELPNIVEQVPLAGFPPAHYAVRVSVGHAGVEIAAASEEFDLTFAESIPRPWVSSRLLPQPGDPVYAEIVGAQLFNLGRFGESRVFLERAFREKPDSEDTAAFLAKVQLALADAPAAAQTLVPFADPPRAPKYETLVLAGEALKRSGAFDRAVELLDRAIAGFGLNAALLNSAGECHEALGNVAEARAAYEKSLELSPDQPEIRRRVDELKKKS